MHEDKEVIVKAHCFRAAVGVYGAVIRNRKKQSGPDEMADEIMSIATALFHRSRRIDYWKTYEEYETGKKQ